MRVIVDSKAKDYISRKSQDSSIRVEGQVTGRGWATYYEPLVKMGPPIDNREFKVYESEGIKLYLAPGIIPKKDIIRVRLTRFLGIRRIVVEGIKITL